MCLESCNRSVSCEGEHVLQITCLLVPEPGWQWCLIASDIWSKPKYLNGNLPFSGAFHLDLTGKWEPQRNRWEMGVQSLSAQAPFQGLFCSHCRALPMRNRAGPHRARQNWVFHRTHTQPLQPDSGLGVGFPKQIVFVYMHLYASVCVCQCVNVKRTAPNSLSPSYVVHLIHF